MFLGEDGGSLMVAGSNESYKFNTSLFVFTEIIVNNILNIYSFQSETLSHLEWT